MLASLLNASGSYGAPLHVWSCSRPSTVVSPWASRRLARIDTRAASASGAGPPNMPECSSPGSASTCTTTLTMPRRLTVTAGTPTAALPVSQTRIASARSRSAFFGTKSSSPPVPCSSEPSTTSLRLTGTSDAQGTQGGQVHQDVALAVGGSAAEPAAVDLGQLEGRGPPGIVVQRRLHVVVRVEQHRRGVGTGAGSAAHHGVAAVSGLVQADVGEPFLTERVDHPVRCARALLGRELAGVGHRLDRDQLGELGTDARHQRADLLPEVRAHWSTVSAYLRSLT